MQIEYRSPTVSEYQALRATIGWWTIDDSAVKIALQNSLFSVVALKENKVVGCGRIVGDAGIYFYIQDLIVHPAFQNKGIGKRIMTELMKHIKKTTEQGAFVGLMAAKGLENYYQTFGFKPRDDDSPGMYYVNN